MKYLLKNKINWYTYSLEDYLCNVYIKNEVKPQPITDKVTKLCTYQREREIERERAHIFDYVLQDAWWWQTSDPAAQSVRGCVYMYM